jgi:TusA-related sulfurtransferase
MINMGENYKLDCSGLVCPMPVAKTKRELSKMKSGEILEVSGDFCEAGENIKRYVETNGGEVLDFNVDGENYYLKIKKL